MGLAETAATLAEWLRQQERVALVSHFDADGLAACAIMRQALQRAGIDTELQVLPLLQESTELPAGPKLLLDVGATLPAPEDAWIIDHHRGEAERMLNPWLEGGDGGRDACTATLAFLVATSLDPKNSDLAPIAIIGLVADSHEKRGLYGLNKDIVEQAEHDGLVAVEERLRLFGYERRSLTSMLIKSRDLRITGVTNSPAGAKRLLEELGIPDRTGGQETMYRDLSDEQRRLLLDVGKRRATRRPASALHFTLLRETELFRDARQVATLLNACGRLEKASVGIAVLEGSERESARAILNEYRDALRDAYAWSKENAEEGKGFVIINAGSRILPSIIGTVCSMAARSGDVPRDTVVFGLARMGEAIKLSLRVNDHSDRDVLSLLDRILEGTDAQRGGHRVAAGALIPLSDEERVIEQARTVLSHPE